MPSCDEVWVALDSSFKEFMDCLGQLTEEELTSTPVVGIWSAKDVVAHVWSWLDEAVRTVQAWQERRPWQEGVTYDDAWNEAEVTKRSGLPLITVVDGITGAHRRLMHLLDRFDEAGLSQVGRAPWGQQMTLSEFLCAMAEHTMEHVPDLRAYRDRCLNGCD